MDLISPCTSAVTPAHTISFPASAYPAWPETVIPSFRTPTTINQHHSFSVPVVPRRWEMSGSPPSHFFLFEIATKTIRVTQMIRILIVDTAISIPSFQPSGYLFDIYRTCAVRMDRFAVQQNHSWKFLHMVLLRSVRLFPRVYTLDPISTDKILQLGYNLPVVYLARAAPRSIEK